jgi:hypothetical protein
VDGASAALLCELAGIIEAENGKMSAPSPALSA